MTKFSGTRKQPVMTNRTAPVRTTGRHSITFEGGLDLAGYRPRSMPAGSRGRLSLAGSSDASFTMMSVLEAGRDAGWPF